MMERERKKGGIKEREDGGREGGDYLRELINRGRSGQWPDLNTINWRDTTHLDYEDDYCSGCQSVIHCLQQPFSGLQTPKQSYLTYLMMFYVSWSDL